MPAILIIFPQSHKQSEEVQTRRITTITNSGRIGDLFARGYDCDSFEIYRLTPGREDTTMADY